jgi:signal transduction histidine kinase
MEDQDPRDLGPAAPPRRAAERVRAWLGSPPAVDVLVVLAVAVPTTGASLATRVGKGPTWIVVLFALAATLPLLVRRRWPFAVLACIFTAAVLSPASLPYAIPLVVGIYTIGAHRSWQATITAYCVVLAAALAYGYGGGSRFHPVDVIPIGFLGAIAAGTGIYIGGKRRSITTLEERTERMDREQRLLAERAVAEERVRISRELHDVIAHNVSLIVVQAQALGATHADEQVNSATEGIADLGRRTMAEMHRTLRLLRAGDDAPEYLPQPGLGDLDQLLAQSRAAGVPVELAVEGVPRRLAQSVDLSAFRIVQEALTNVLKHAGRARTAVTISYGPEALDLTIVDAGIHHRGDGRRGAPGGHGLIGMRERTALFGGTLTAGPRPGQGFEVRASLPYDERLA